MTIYDLIIIGGGPAGISAGVYAARKQLKTLLITYALDSQQDFGGQSVVSEDVQNWIGFTSISGTDLAKKLEEHLRAYAGNVVDIKTGKRVARIEKKAPGEGFVVKIESGEVYEGKTLLITTGSVRRKLTVPGAAEFEHKGITYCASCDGPLFSGRDVAVIGGGNAGFETAAQLLAYTKSVTILDSGETFRADPITIEKVLANQKTKGVTSAELLEIKGEKFVTTLIYKDSKTGEVYELPVGGIFVEIGLIPATSFAEGVVDLTDRKQIKVDPRTQRASVEGIWAAGDCTDGLYHQNNIASGDAVKALEDIFLFLNAKL